MLTDLIFVHLFHAKQSKDVYRKGGYKIIIIKHKNNKVSAFTTHSLKFSLLSKFAWAEDLVAPYGCFCVCRQTQAQCHYPNDVLMKTQCRPGGPAGDQVVFFNLFTGGWDQKLL